MNADGSRATRAGPGRRPAWSPDGRRIAFEHTAAVSAARPVYQVGVMNPDGARWTLLPVLERDGAAVTIGHPAWSPDGQWLAFHGQPTADGARWSAIYRSRPDGRDLQEVVRKETTPGVGFSAVYSPAWSPDDRWIAYSAANGGIRLIDPDTGENRDLAVAQRDERGRGPQDLDASWSPDGTRIAFFRFGDFHPPTP